MEELQEKYTAICRLIEETENALKSIPKDTFMLQQDTIDLAVQLRQYEFEKSKILIAMEELKNGT